MYFIPLKKEEEVIRVYGVSIGLQPQSSARLIAKIKEGLSVKTFDRLCKNLDISEKALAKTLNIAISTLARRKKTGRMTFGESAVLKEPSVVVPEEYNFLLNPNHPDFEKITIGTPIVYPFDPRLAR